MRTNLLQAMASGMTFSTAEHKALPCEGSFREDLVGLRPGGRCSYVHQPGFGMVEVDWEQRVVSLSIRNHTNGGSVAAGYDGSRQLLRFDLDSCKMLSS
jgi:alkaline phosphatase D